MTKSTGVQHRHHQHQLQRRRSRRHQHPASASNGDYGYGDGDSVPYSYKKRKKSKKTTTARYYYHQRLLPLLLLCAATTLLPLSLAFVAMSPNQGRGGGLGREGGGGAGVFSGTIHGTACMTKKVSASTIKMLTADDIYRYKAEKMNRGRRTTGSGSSLDAAASDDEYSSPAVGDDDDGATTNGDHHHPIGLKKDEMDDDADDGNDQQQEENQHQKSPILTVGVLADIQHADVEDGHSYSGTPRYYRHALQTTRVAAEHFQSTRVSLVINLGDTIDGKCRQVHGRRGAHRAIDAVVDAPNVYDCGRVVHTYGNHELYNLRREELGKKLGIPFFTEEEEGEEHEEEEGDDNGGDVVWNAEAELLAEERRKRNSSSNTKKKKDLVGYHTFKEGPFRFVVLDTYDIATLDRCRVTSTKRKQAERLLERHNPNHPHLSNSPEGLVGLQKRFVAFNGGVDAPQLFWLRETLERARETGDERVIVLSHQPIMPESTNPVCLIWNYDDVLSILREYSDVVVASFAGHAHRGGYCRDSASGIHFRVMEAVLESNHPHKTYGFWDLYDDRLEVRGVGECESATYDFSHTTSAASATATTYMRMRHAAKR